MMSVLLAVVGAIGFAALIIAVHEHGHRFAALLAGVPADQVRVVLNARPAHTALRDSDRWLAPDDDGYQVAFRRHQPGAGWAYVFIAGGLVAGMIVTAGAVLLLAVVGKDDVAVVLAATTLGLFLLYLAGDLVLTWRHGAPAGDHSALWQIHPPATVALIIGVAALKTATVLIVWRRRNHDRPRIGREVGDYSGEPTAPLEPPLSANTGRAAWAATRRADGL